MLGILSRLSLRLYAFLMNFAKVQLKGSSQNILKILAKPRAYCSNMTYKDRIMVIAQS